MAEFLDMGGYALYVWSSFGAAAVCMLGEPVLLRMRRHAILRRLARLNRMEQDRAS